MDTSKAEKEVKEFTDLGYKFNFDRCFTNKIEIGIKLPGYSIMDILSLLREDEKISFLINHGHKIKHNVEYHSEKYDGSIYWEDVEYVGDRIRISTNMSDFRNVLKNYSNILKRRDKINKILKRK